MELNPFEGAYHGFLAAAGWVVLSCLCVWNRVVGWESVDVDIDVDMAMPQTVGTAVTENSKSRMTRVLAFLCQSKKSGMYVLALLVQMEASRLLSRLHSCFSSVGFSACCASFVAHTE